MGDAPGETPPQDGAPPPPQTLSLSLLFPRDAERPGARGMFRRAISDRLTAGDVEWLNTLRELNADFFDFQGQGIPSCWRGDVKLVLYKAEMKSMNERRHTIMHQ